jgi:hypothetical protein
VYLFVNIIPKSTQLKTNIHSLVVIIINERPSIMSHIFWPCLTYLPINFVLLYNIPFWGLSWTPLPTLISDVINGHSLKYGFCKKLLRYKWTSDQLNTLIRPKSIRSNFLQNPYFSPLFRRKSGSGRIKIYKPS